MGDTMCEMNLDEFGQLEHVFELNTMKYDIENGNWGGLCANCGKVLTVYTGDSYHTPRGAGLYGMVAGDDACTGAEFCADHIVAFKDPGLYTPNIIVKYKRCKKACPGETYEKLAADYDGVTYNSVLSKHLQEVQKCILNKLKERAPNIQLESLKVGEYYRCVRDYKGKLTLIKE